jgi:hypothetical protein
LVPNEHRSKDLLPAMQLQRASTGDIMKAVIQDETNDLLEELLETMKLLIPVGLTKSLTVNVNSSITQLDEKNTQPFGIPWKSILMFNDGPGVVYHVLNRDYFDQTPWKPNDGPLRYEMMTDQIKKILFTTGSGGSTATIRIFSTK